MTKRLGSARRKTRHMMTKPKSMKGKFPVGRLTQSFEVGQRVVLKAEPSIHKGVYFRRFHGMTATIAGKRGNSYEVFIKEGNVIKMLLVNPVHMVKI